MVCRRPAAVVLVFAAATAPAFAGQARSLFLPPLRPSADALPFSDDVRADRSPPSFLEYDTREGSAQVGDLCDISTTGSLCFSSKAAVLQAAAKPPGLVGRWTFDEELALDSSGNGNHGTSAGLVHGPSPAGNGHSALFRKSFLTLPHSPLYESADFAFTFWVYVPTADVSTRAVTPNWCPLMRKGVHAPQADHFESSPALLYSYATGHLRVSLSTTTHNGANAPDGQFVNSNARLRPNRWMHLAILKHGPRVLLYVNGILDAVMPLHGQPLINHHALYVGGDPFSAEQCTHAVYIDELRVYSRALAPHELEAQAVFALGGTSPSFVHLGCANCGAVQARNSCPHSRHVCSDVELYAGGYQVARTQGWLVKGVHVWTADLLLHPAISVGLALCCEGMK